MRSRLWEDTPLKRKSKVAVVTAVILIDICRRKLFVGMRKSQRYPADETPVLLYDTVNGLLLQQSRQKHAIKHKEEHKPKRTKKYTKLNYKNTIR